MDKMRLGGGGRFEKLVGQLEKKGVKDPSALAAYIGRKQLGKAKFQSLAAKVFAERCGRRLLTPLPTLKVVRRFLIDDKLLWLRVSP